VNEVINGTIHGSTCFGKINVIWEGDKPEIGKTYHVELDIDGVYVWGQDIVSSDDDISIICNGILESIDDDGYAVLRMGDYIIPFLTKGDSFEIGSKINVHVKLVSAYPIS
jgi:hypothetical protein